MRHDPSAPSGDTSQLAGEEGAGFLVGSPRRASSRRAALALDRLFPPDLSRYHERSTEVVDANGRLLRAFTTVDGKWRLKTTVDDVDPVYLALLKAYEDRRFDAHLGVDPLAVVRAAEQLDRAAAASCRAPRRSPCRPPACSSPRPRAPSPTR